MRSMRESRASVHVWRFFMRTVKWSKTIDSFVGASKYLLAIWAAIFLIACTVLAGTTLAIVFYFDRTGWWIGLLILAIALTGVLGIGSLMLAYKHRPSATTPTGQRRSLDRAQDPQIAVYLPVESCTRHPLMEGDRHLGRDGVFCHLAVKSLTGADIPGCRATLRAVAKAEDGQYVEDQRFSRSLRLKWANFMPHEPEAESRTIEGDKPGLLDIVCSDEATPDVATIVTLDTEPIGVPKAFGPGVYRLTVRVAPESGPNEDFTFLLMVIDGVFGVSLSPYLGEPPPTGPSRPPRQDIPVPTAGTYAGGTISMPAGATGAPSSPELRDIPPVELGPLNFPVVFQMLGLGQDDDTDKKNTRIGLDLRAINRGDVDASLVFHLGIGSPDSDEVPIWQQAREPGAHALAVLLPGGGNAVPTEIPRKKHADLKLEFLIAKDYLANIRRDPPPAFAGHLGAIRMEALWIRAKDLITGSVVEKRLPVDEA